MTFDYDPWEDRIRLLRDLLRADLEKLSQEEMKATLRAVQFYTHVLARLADQEGQ